MATTEHFYAGTGSQTSFPFEFPYLTESDVFVELYNSSTGNFDIKQLNTSGQNNDYSISNTNIVFNVAPPQIANVNNIHIYRNTDVETAKAVYGTGSAIRAQDLNDNTNQSLYKLQEGSQLINTDDIKDEAINSAKIKDGTIVNTDISPTAEIAVSKLANGTARQLLQTAANGTDVEFTSNVDIPGTLDVTGNTTLDANLIVSNNLNVDGTSTVDQAATFASTVGIGGQTTINAHLDVNAGASINDVQIGVAGNNEITTASGNLELDSASGTTRVDDDLVVTGSITAPLWNGNHIDTFWLTNKQHINHIGETITLGKSSTGTGSSFAVNNNTHSFNIAKNYAFNVGTYVNEGNTFGNFNGLSYQPCFQVKHELNIPSVTKTGSTSYTVTNTSEKGYINLGTGQSSWINSNTNLHNTQVHHSNLVLSGIRGNSSSSAISNPNNYCPDVVLHPQRGVMFTHPDNVSETYTYSSNPNYVYSALNSVANGAYTQGVFFGGDPVGWGNNGYLDASECLTKLEAAVDFQIIVGGARAKNRFEIGSSSVAGTLSLSGTDVTSTANEINILDGVTSNTSELNKLDGFTGTTSDLEEVVTGKTVEEQINGNSSNTQLPTALAVNNRIIELMTDVGGFHPIADEVSFPTTNPDINDGAGTIVSIGNAAGLKVANGSGSGTYAGTAGNSIGATTTAGTAVTITGIDSSLHGTTIAGKGMLVETTTTLNEYTYHRLVVDEAGVASAQAAIDDFDERYYGPHAANQATRPSGANRLNGDLYFNTSDGKMKVFNGVHATGTWDDVAAPGNFFINTLSSSSGSGGNSAAFNNTATRFTLSNPPLTAQQLLVSVNGVIQKPNSGTSPSEGFAIDGADIIFASAPATGAPFFIVTIGSSVNIGTPSNNTVGSAQIIDGSIDNIDISSTAGILKSKLAALEIVDADINTSANIAKSKLASLNIANGDVSSSTSDRIDGNKITPNFGGQAITTTGYLNCGNQLTVGGTEPRLVFTDSDHNPDFTLWSNGGNFKIYDTTNSTARLHVNSSGNIGINTELQTYQLYVNGSGANGLFASGTTTTALSTGYGASSSHILRCENSEIAIGLANASPYNLYLQGRTNGSVARPLSINPLGGDVAIGSNSYENIPLHVSGQSGQTTALKLKSVETSVNMQWQMIDSNSVIRNLCLQQFDGTSFNQYTPSAASTPTLELQTQINHHGIVLNQGKGINFYNFGQGTGVDSNKFDDYEYGTFTPTLNGTYSNLTFRGAKYIKVGNLIQLQIEFYTAAGNFSTGTDFRLSGLPFANITSHPTHLPGSVQYMNSAYASTVMANYLNTSGEWYVNQASGSGLYLWMNISYHIG